jgi:hypothetical protein
MTMSKEIDAGWENALTVVQEVQPPFIPDGAHAMTVVIDYPPGSAGAPPHRHPSGHVRVPAGSDAPKSLVKE